MWISVFGILMSARDLATRVIEDRENESRILPTTRVAGSVRDF